MKLMKFQQYNNKQAGFRRHKEYLVVKEITLMKSSAIVNWCAIREEALY